MYALNVVYDDTMIIVLKMWIVDVFLNSLVLRVVNVFMEVSEHFANPH